MNKTIELIHAIQGMMKEAGAFGVTLIALLTAITALLTANVVLPEAGVDTQPTEDDVKIQVVAASGVEGLDVELFCADPLTRVVPLLAPDASGIVYQLGRTRDGATETVSVVLDAEGVVTAATHYFDTSEGQQSAPAFLTSKARECIEQKAE